MNKQAEYKKIREKILSCKDCDLCNDGDLLDDYGPHVCGEGNLDAKVCFIAEAPGFYETKYGRPLTPEGKSGNVLKNMLKYFGLTRKDVFIMNVCSCRPPNNDDPDPYQVKACLEYFDKQIELVDPKLIVALGRFASNALLNGGIKITKDHGKIYKSEKYGDVFVLYHPSYYLAYSSVERRKEFKKDVKKLKRIIKEL